jgi:hypothetical protein
MRPAPHAPPVIQITPSPLSEAGFDACCRFLDTGAAELWTLLAVETQGCGFLPDRRAAILFERPVFHRLTHGKFDATNPSISSATPGGYLGGTAEYHRLDAAVALDRDAALRSTSWGIGQVMGLNAVAAGFASVEGMVAAMQASEDPQLAATAHFLRSSHLDGLLAQHDWTEFARGYNGPNFQVNRYDERLAAAFAGFSSGALPDVRVRQVQIFLMFNGWNVGAIDGILGKRTRSAVAAYKEQTGIELL